MVAVPYEFRYDQRLQISKPHLYVTYEELSEEQREEYELLCQRACSGIPDQIHSLEEAYMACFEQLTTVEDDDQFHTLLDEMNELSSRISDLNVLYLQLEGHFLNERVHA